MFPAYAPGVKGASTSYNGLYGEAPGERGTFFHASGIKKGGHFTVIG